MLSTRLGCGTQHLRMSRFRGHRILRHLRLGRDQGAHAVQCIEQKMRVELRFEQSQLRRLQGFGQLHLPQAGGDAVTVQDDAKIEHHPNDGWQAEENALIDHLPAWRQFAIEYVVQRCERRAVYAQPGGFTVPQNAPPMFAALAMNDPAFGGKGFAVVDSWNKAGRPVELHAYQTGGHAFGVECSRERWT